MEKGDIKEAGWGKEEGLGVYEIVLDLYEEWLRGNGGAFLNFDGAIERGVRHCLCLGYLEYIPPGVELSSNHSFYNTYNFT